MYYVLDVDKTISILYIIMYVAAVSANFYAFKSLQRCFIIN